MVKKKSPKDYEDEVVFHGEEMVEFGQIIFEGGVKYATKAKMVTIGDKSVALLFDIDPDLEKAARTPHNDLRPDVAAALDDHLVSLVKSGVHHPMIEILMEAWEVDSGPDDAWGVALGYTTAEKTDPIYRSVMISPPKALRKKFKETVVRFSKLTVAEHIVMTCGRG